MIYIYIFYISCVEEEFYLKWASFKMFLRFPSTRNRKAKLKSSDSKEFGWIPKQKLATLAIERRKFRRGLYEHGDIYDDYLAAIEITFTHDAIASVPPPSASSVPIVPDILRFRGWNNYNWSNLVLRTIYLLRSLSKQLPHNLSRPFLTLSIARERDFILSSFDQLPPFYTCICIHDRGQNWVERFNSIVFKI